MNNNTNIQKLAHLEANERIAVLEFVQLLRETFGSIIHEVILFGSKARGVQTNESDIDILIVLDNISFEIKKAISELAAKENLKHNVLISTIRYESAAWENSLVRQSPFGQAIRNEGIWL